MADGKTRIVINGFGRIGRTILRILATEPRGAEFEVMAINDIEPLATCAYLFRYDSVFGPLPVPVEAGAEGLVLGQTTIPFHATPDLRTVDLSGVDLVLECTGMAGARAVAERGLSAGARAVLVSGPSNEADVTVVLGANQHLLDGQRIVSNASCTTNALAPLLNVLDEAFGVESGHMTTVHCYTGSQPTVDKPRGDPARSRAAALSMVPTTTSAQQLVDVVLPHLAGRVEARAIRVPTASVSAIDLAVQTTRPATAEAVNAALIAASGAVIGCTSEPLVSTDLRARSESIVMSLSETSVSTGGLLRVFGWYDNEWGFSNRMLDVARMMARA